MQLKVGNSIELSSVITSAIVAFFVTSDIYTPSMPSIAREFSATEDHVQWSMVFFMLGAFVSTLGAGPLAERYGRRLMFVGGQGLAALSALLCLFSPNLEVLLIARFFMGLGGAVTTVLGYSAVQDVYSPERTVKIFAVMGAAFAIVPALAPILGGYLDVWFGWRASFAVMFGVVLISFIVSYYHFVLPPKNDMLRTTRLKVVLDNYVKILMDRKFIRYSTMNSILISAEWCYITLLPFYFIGVIGVSSAVYGYYLAAMFLCYGIGAHFSEACIHRFGHDQSIRMALWISIVGAVSLFAVHFLMPLNPVMVAISIGICFVGQGLSFSPSITKTLESFPDLRASASSVRSSINNLFSVFGTLIASVLYDNSLMPLSIYIFALPLLGLFIFRLMYSPRDDTQKT